MQVAMPAVLQIDKGIISSDIFSTDLASTTYNSNSSQSSGEDQADPPSPKNRASVWTDKQFTKLLKKTSLCKHFLKGHCFFEDKCQYAHHASELQPKPNFAKTRMCAHFLAGYCKNDHCRYAHDQAEVKETSSISGQPQEQDETTTAKTPKRLPKGEKKNQQPQEVPGALLAKHVEVGYQSMPLMMPEAPSPWAALSQPRFVNEHSRSSAQVPLRLGEPMKIGLSSCQDEELVGFNMDQSVDAWQGEIRKPLPTGPVRKPLPTGPVRPQVDVPLPSTVVPRCGVFPDAMNGEWLLGFLQACENADALDDVMKYPLQQIFMTDARLTSKFPRLSAKLGVPDVRLSL